LRPIARDGQVVVSFDMGDAFTADVRDAIESGLTTTFSYRVELRQGSGLFDRTVASVRVSATVRYDNLTRRHQMSRAVDGGVDDARPRNVWVFWPWAGTTLGQAKFTFVQ
jgi:Domain of unknown function (DUF4390)